MINGRVLFVLLLTSLTSLLGEEIRLKDLEGREQSLEQHKGKIVILNFWATWCRPCREEMPILVRIQNRYKERGVVVIGASADESGKEEEIARFVKQAKINFPIWIGATIAEMQQLGLPGALPATAVFDRDGTISGQIVGKVDEEDLLRRIDWMLGSRGEPAPPAFVNTMEKHDHEHEPPGESKAQAEEEEHEHASVGIEGASTVPS